MHARLCLSPRTQCRPWQRGGMAMGVRNTYVTSRMDTQMLSRLSPGASHKRRCAGDKRGPTGCDVSEQLARIMRCTSIPLSMPDADYTSTRSQRQGVMTLGVRMTCASRPATSSVLHQACTHDAGTPKALGPLGEARLGGEEGPERLKKTGMQNEV